MLPIAAHVALATSLYALLTLARAPKIRGVGKRSDASKEGLNNAL